MKKYILLFLLSGSALAVHINPKGTGEVLLIPYYTVNNSLNTAVALTNTTGATKAIKINIRESLNGYGVMTYNVYLSPYDTWTFVMGAVASNQTGYEGQDFAAHATNDNSCAPFLNKAFQEFDPSLMYDGSQDIGRAREGFIEIIEMGELQEGLVDHVAQDSNGVPNNCQALENLWEGNGGHWNVASDGDPNQYISPSSGGLMAEADIIDVNEGINYSIPVVALANFFADDDIRHVSPRHSSLSLDAAAALATVYANKKSYQLSFDRGIDAVSAVLMADEVTSTYNFEAAVDGQNETVYTQPTRRFYQTVPNYEALAPYPTTSANGCSNQAVYGGVELEHTEYDREGTYNVAHGGFPVPPSPNDSFCGSVFVQSIVSPGSGLSEPPLTQSNNFQLIQAYNGAETESGFTKIGFVDTRPLVGTDINTDKTVHLMGLPIIGVTLGRFTNSNAAPGIMAQYGFSQPIKKKTRLIEID